MGLMATSWLLSCLAFFSLTACGNVTVDSPSGGGGDACPTMGSAGSTTSSSGMGGSGGTTCTPVSQGAGGFVQPTCDDLSVLTISDPVVTDSDGDGLVSAGEEAFIQANLN